VKILIHGINYSPDLTGIGKYSGEMAEWLAVRGLKGDAGLRVRTEECVLP